MATRTVPWANYSLLSLKNLYQNFTGITNVRFISKHKKYLKNIPSFPKHRPRALVTDILDKISRVMDEMRSTVKKSINNTSTVKSAPDNMTLFHTVCKR